MPEFDICPQKIQWLTLMMFHYERLNKSLTIYPCGRKMLLAQPFWRIFYSGIKGLASSDVYFREHMFWRYLPWSLNHLITQGRVKKNDKLSTFCEERKILRTITITNLLTPLPLNYKCHVQKTFANMQLLLILRFLFNRSQPTGSHRLTA